jgi:hypothetical protein
MTTKWKELRKVIEAEFEGDAWDRFKFGLWMDTHNYIELCKEPALRLGLGEAWADRTKYIIGYAIPAILAVALEWAVSGSLL